MNLPKRKPSKRIMGTKPNTRVCEQHKKWVRGHECSIAGKSGHLCFGRIEFAHVRNGIPAELRHLAGGLGVKPSDILGISLCADAHAESHNIGWQSFSKAYAIDMVEIALGLARKSPHLKKLGVTL